MLYLPGKTCLHSKHLCVQRNKKVDKMRGKEHFAHFAGVEEGQEKRKPFSVVPFTSHFLDRIAHRVERPCVWIFFTNNSLETVCNL